MTLSIWRFAHLALAIVSSLFLLILSITGVILAVDAVNGKIPSYKVENFEELNVAQSVSGLGQVYPEIIEIAIDYNNFVSIDALDKDGNSVKGYIHPITGELLGEVKPKSQFIEWNIALHRSLFLKNTGRIIIGLVSFLLVLITISGIVLIIKRQQGIRHFFAKINNDFFAQYFHVISGRLLLVPILILSITGTYLFLIRMDIIKKPNQEIEYSKTSEEVSPKNLKEFKIFKETKLSEVEKIEFPFIQDDPDEFYILKLKDRALTINQLNGEIVEETKYPYSAFLETLSLDLHTGRTSILWAIILGIASLNILFFIYSGFVITFKRTRTKVRNKFNAENAEIIILVGTENGSTLFFANQIHKQLLADGKRSFITEMNKYRKYPKAQHLLIFTSTYGLGDAPTNAIKFEELLRKHPQEQNVEFSVVGFGSKAYEDYCAYASHIDALLGNEKWATRFIGLHTVNDKSLDDLIKWIHHWSEKSLIALATAPAVYNEKVAGLKKFKVVSLTKTSEDNHTFKILLKPVSKTKFQSGDLLAIYPAGDNRERFYSIGRNKGMIQLMVKLYPDGLGSGYLYQLEKNSVIQARVMSNPNFHFPKQASAVAMVANGTGIAPFLGMIMENGKHTPVYLYSGFRNNNTLTRKYHQFASAEVEKKHLIEFDFAFSREQSSQYVMDLIQRDALRFIELLENNGVLMICGSLNMQRDVEKVLDDLLIAANNKSVTFYKENNQILTDCY